MNPRPVRIWLNQHPATAAYLAAVGTILVIILALEALRVV